MKEKRDSKNVLDLIIEYGLPSTSEVILHNVKDFKEYYDFFVNSNTSHFNCLYEYRLRKVKNISRETFMVTAKENLQNAFKYIFRLYITKLEAKHIEKKHDLEHIWNVFVSNKNSHILKYLK